MTLKETALKGVTKNASSTKPAASNEATFNGLGRSP